MGLTQKPLRETIWRMAESGPTIFAGDRAWILGCRYHRCSNHYRRDYRRVGHTHRQSERCKLQGNKRPAVGTDQSSRWSDQRRIMQPLHVYEVRKNHRGVDLISDAPFGRLWYGEPNAASNAVDYANST